MHDHLAWGLIGLYRGNQDEEIYRQVADGLELVRQRPLEPGDFYRLLPPLDDIHRVRTTSDVTSVSIHLLASDTGCILRHAYDEETGEARPVPLRLRERRVRSGAPVGRGASRHRPDRSRGLERGFVRLKLARELEPEPAVEAERLPERRLEVAQRALRVGAVENGA